MRRRILSVALLFFAMTVVDDVKGEPGDKQFGTDGGAGTTQKQSIKATYS